MTAFNTWRGGFAAQPSSMPITGLVFGTPYRYNEAFPKVANGDVWYNTWAADGEIYAACGDFETPTFEPPFVTDGPYTGFTHFDGYTNEMTGSLVNLMRMLGRQGQVGTETPGYTFKPSGLISVNGVMYLAAARQKYGIASTDYIQSSVSCQLMKTTDYGLNWTPIPPGEASPFSSPQFNSPRFGAPGFIQYGTADYQGNTEHNSDLYVYAVSPDGVWNNGSSMILGRCLIDDMPNLSAADWSYYTGGDGMVDANWSSNMNDGALIVSKTRGIGMTTVQFIPFCRRYLMVQWYYPQIKAGSPNGATYPATSVWDTYESEFPWGPWTLVQSDNWPGYYTPVVIQKSVSADDGRNVQLVFSGNFFNQEPIETADYQLTLLSAEIVT